MEQKISIASQYYIHVQIFSKSQLQSSKRKICFYFDTFHSSRRSALLLLWFAPNGRWELRVLDRYENESQNKKPLPMSTVMVSAYSMALVVVAKNSTTHSALRITCTAHSHETV